MRKAFAAREEERATFHGTFERCGIKNGWQGRQEQTILLKDICDQTGKRVCDHLWFNLTKAFAILNLQPGDTVAFDARVKAYEKGYFGRRPEVYKPPGIDYKLSHPTKVRKVGAAAPQGETMPPQWYVSRSRLRFTTDPATGDHLEPDFDNAGPFATAAQAQAYAEAHGWHQSTVRESHPYPGMVPCPTCGLLVWPDDPHPEHDGGHVACSG